MHSKTKQTNKTHKKKEKKGNKQNINTEKITLPNQPLAERNPKNYFGLIKKRTNLFPFPVVNVIFFSDY